MHMEVSGNNEKASNDYLAKYKDPKDDAVREENKDPKDVAEKMEKARNVKLAKRPIILTACLFTDIIVCLLSFLMFNVLLANNPRSFPKLQAYQNFGKEILEDLMIASNFGLVTTALCFVTAMLIFIYSSVVVRQAWKIYNRKELGFLDISV